jgi:hypothetical protein
MVQQGVNPFHHAVDVSFVACSAYSYLLGLVFQLGGHVQGHHQYRNLWRPSSDFFSGVQAVHFGHLEIKDDYIRFGLLGSLDRF